MTSPRTRIRLSSRRGAMLLLVCIMLPVLLVLAAFAVNVTYMEMIRTETRLACDSAAKAAIVRLQSSQSQSDARDFARTVSSCNRVAGQPLSFADSQIEFGNSAPGQSGQYQFTIGGMPLNSARVTGTRSVPMIVGGFSSTTSFVTSQVSVATRINHDIVLVLDRSASMAFDLSSNEFSYPSDRQSGTVFQSYFSPPSQTGSRWKALADAVGRFTNALNTRQLDVQVAVVTYAENYSFGQYSSGQASTDQDFTKNTALISTAMNAWFQRTLIGDTNIEAGLTQSQTVFNGNLSRTTAQRTIVLLTDGVATSGNTDIAAVVQQVRQNTNAVVHIISFSGQSSAGTNVYFKLQDAATKGNGQFYQAPTVATLDSAFGSIADSLPAILTQ